ncbi:MAG: hypothetical protein V4510_10060 [bacterium]
MENGTLYPMPSGATLYVSVSEYEKVMALHDALFAEARGGGLGAIDAASVQKAFVVGIKARAAKAAGKPVEETSEGDAGLNFIVDKLITVIGSRTVKSALFACSDKAVYRPNGSEASSIQLDPAAPGYGVFDNPACMLQARGDFYDICKAIGEENLRPFGPALLSMFMALMGISADIPKSNSAPA